MDRVPASSPGPPVAALLVPPLVVGALVVPAEGGMVMADELVLRALHFYNTGEGLTRAEIVDMAKTIERQRTAMLKAATAIAVMGSGKTEPVMPYPGHSIADSLRAAARREEW